MPRFRFPLQAVLDQREREERERRVAVARLEAERRGLEDALRSRQDGIRRVKGELREALGPGKPIDAGGLRLQVGAALRSQMDAQQLALRLAGVHRRLDGARGALTEAAKRRRGVELLKERRFAAWREAIERRERAEADDIGASGGARRALLSPGAGKGAGR